MTRITEIKYRCNTCGKGETNKQNLLYWFKVTLVGDELHVFRNSMPATPFRADFCSRECLAKWAAPVELDNAPTDDTE